jgi:hypothetical protein
VYLRQNLGVVVACFVCDGGFPYVIFILKKLKVRFVMLVTNHRKLLTKQLQGFD